MLDYDIHIVEKVGFHGSILANFQDGRNRLNDGEKKMHVSARNMENIFFL
jgi:hypothetical protein